MADETWFILRTAGRSTLTLAETLADDGFSVWTPVRPHMIRNPKMNVRREVKLPMLPSFVFAKSAHLLDLLEMANSDERPRRFIPGSVGTKPAHRDFSVFHYMDQIPMIRDQALDPLRARETREADVAARLRPEIMFDTGATVSVKSGAFQGLKGRVERCKSGYALVIFTDWRRPVQIPTFLLHEDEAIIAHHRVAKVA